VIRNRVRRRLRVILRASALPGGDYLFGVTPAVVELTFVQLQSRVDTLVARCVAQAGG
jgi:ribonuclease P protein component